MAEKQKPKFSRYLGQPELRPVLYLYPLVLAVVMMAFFFMPLPWNVVTFVILFALLAILGAMSWRLARATLQLKTETQQMESTIEHLSIGVVAYDAEFTTLIFNPAAEEIFGVQEAKVLGKKLTTEMASDPELKVLAQTIFPTLAPTVVRGSEPGVFPQVVDISFDEPRLDLRVSTDRMLDAKGNVNGFLKLITDRTREIELLKSKTEFISVAAHQLRTPLTAVNWAFEGLSQSQSLPDSEKDLVKTGFSAAKKMLKTVNDLLDVSKIEEGRFGYQLEEIDITSYLEEILADSNNLAKQYGIKLYFQRTKESLPHVFIDKQKLSMVLYNLLDNAIKYNVERGEVTVSVQKEEREPFVRVSIADTGIGIPREELDKLFGKFFRASNAIKFVPDGTGLGLYIARNIVHRHGGRIWAQSEPNRGSTFFFTIPTDASLIPKKEWSAFE